MAAPMKPLADVVSTLESWVQGEDRDRAEPGLDLLQSLSDMFRDPENRELAEENIFQLLLQFLSQASHKVQSVELGPDAFGSWFYVIAECFRCLRNSCVRCTQNQNAIRNVGLLFESVSLIKSFTASNPITEPGLVALRCGLQFLGNAAAGNPDSQNSIWKCAFPDLFLNCLKHGDEKVSGYGSMVLFTCLSDDTVAELKDPTQLDVALNVITSYRNHPDADWLHLIVTGHFLKCPELVKSMYVKQTDQERITMLEIIMAKFNEREPIAPEDAISLQRIGEFLSDCFQNQCQAVLKLTIPGNSSEQEALVVVRLLDVLCEMTSNNDFLPCLQSRPSLLETVIDILRLTHLAGKQAKNVFTPTHSTSLGSELTHAVVGFKVQLIRMISNLCYKSQENQDKVYQLEGIPLILDNCSIDDNNPFLNQWAVYAIRNLTENNKRNQELIASMERQGLADTSLLKGLGYDVEERDGKLVLKSTRKS
ncbi:ataxin-10 isoform X1 [Pelobates cultripes]|uniref:Ataxin-10 n=1 Tax=Pelobates cultripes TaxID=61616 RepID=A0AAD1VYK6_PELCU|nr:ataxin-10 isoform X1 [Pelobates cultripes]